MRYVWRIHLWTSPALSIFALNGLYLADGPVDEQKPECARCLKAGYKCAGAMSANIIRSLSLKRPRV